MLRPRPILQEGLGQGALEHSVDLRDVEDLCGPGFGCPLRGCPKARNLLAQLRDLGPPGGSGLEKRLRAAPALVAELVVSILSCLRLAPTMNHGSGM